MIRNINFDFGKIVKILLTGGILALIFLRLDYGLILEHMRHMDGIFWCTALAFMALQVFALALRWQFLVNDKGHKLQYAEALQITMASLVANFLFITSISGVFVRIGLTAQHGFTIVKTVCAAVVDRLLTLFALLALAALFLPFLAQYVDVNGGLYQLMTLGIAVFVVLAFIFTPFFFRLLWNKGLINNRKYISAFNYLRSVLMQPEKASKVALISIAGQVCYFVAIFFLAHATDVHIGILGLFVVLPAITLVASLPISFGGWGVREGAFIYGLGLLGVPMEAAFLISVQIGIMGMITVMLIGLPAIIGNDMQGMKNKAALAAQSCGRLFDRS